MTNAKQKFVDYREGSFVDFEGKDHYFVVCAVLRESTIRENVTRILSFGVSFCNPVDKHNNELGKKIAYGKSISDRKKNVKPSPTILNKINSKNCLLSILKLFFLMSIIKNKNIAVKAYL